MSRKSAPQSMTTTPSGSAAAISADWPCGRPRKTTSWPASTSGVVSSSVRSASGTRCGWRPPSWLAGVRAAGERADLDVGMGEQQPEDLATGIAAGTGDGHGVGHVHNHTDSCMFRITGVRPVGGHP